MTGALSRRLAAFLAAILVAAVGIVWFGAVRGAEVSRRMRAVTVDELALTLDRVAAAMPASAPYRPPTAAERGTAVAALRSLSQGGGSIAGRTELASLGFTVTEGTDAGTGRRYLLAMNEAGTERAWGTFLIDRSAPIRLVIEVPHPRADLHTETVGLALFRALPGSVLVIAGAHRRAAGGAADVAHRADSLFHAVSADFAERRLPQVQLHGFHDQSLPGRDLVLSAGAADAGTTARRVGAELVGAGFAVCQAWRDTCGPLTGTRNEQGRAAERLGTVFLHVEIGRSVRDSRARLADLVRALAVALATGR